MILKLENIGKIKDKTEIKLDGITVLAGENGAGKSTIGKALFCVFDTFYNIDEQIENERTASVRRILLRESTSPQSRLHIRTTAAQDMIVSEYYNSGDVKAIKSIINKIYSPDDNDIDYDVITQKIIKALDVSDEVIEERLLYGRLNAEFEWEIGNVNYKELSSKIEIDIQGKSIICEFDKVGETTIKKSINLLKNIVYIDDVYAINMLLHSRDRYIPTDSYSHFTNLLKKISDKGNSGNSIIDDVIMDERISGMIKKMDAAGIGDVKWIEDKGWVYRADGLQEDISISNISSGVKGFVLLRQLMKNGYIEEKGVLILDEPEIHLHPKWQKIYAEIIIQLQREFDLTILVSTHSTDFLSFIEYYTKVTGIENCCNYYLLRENSNKTASTIEDVTSNTDVIYSELSKPFLRVSEDLDRLEG